MSVAGVWIPVEVARWAAGPDTGCSSKALFGWFAGGLPPRDYPVDADDFGRCYRLLKLAPEWRERMAELTHDPASPSWRALAKHWEELEQLYMKDRRACSLRIDALLDLGGTA